MQHTPESQAFVDAASAAHSVEDLGQALKPALEHEADLRKRFAASRHNVADIHAHAGLVDLFAADTAALRVTKAREVTSDEDLFAKHVMPLKDDFRRKTGEPAMADSLDQFRTVWSVFSEGTLGQLGQGPWENVIVAGGSVLACLLPLPERVTKQNSKRALRKWFHEDAIWAASDVDVFLWGLSGPEEAEKKCIQIYEAVRDSIPWDVTCVRTKHAITIHSQFPYRSVQIVLRLYASPAEILAGFDVDCACVAYDGSRVWASPRAVAALMRQCNTIDVTRRSPSYEVRLAKYNSRGFEISVPDLRRADIDPTIYERALSRMTGLARLLVLEKITSSEERMEFLSARRSLRGIPSKSSQYVRRARKYKGDLKGDTAGLDISSYENAMFHIPYGPKYDAARIERLIYGNDLGLNSTFNPKNKGRPNLHRHTAFFGTMTECIEDCCEYCPDPVDDEAKALQATEDEVYIRGRVQFIEDDPGRQSVGSFKPLDAEDWAAQAYIGPLEKLFNAIARHDLDAVKAECADSPDLVSRDHVGRTALHVAIICDAPIEVCEALVKSGARITSRLPDGRTPLMLAAQKGDAALAKLLLAKSERNKSEEEARKVAEAAKALKKEPKLDNDGEDDGEDDDEEEEASDESWSDVGDKAKETPDGAADEDAIEAEEEQPDIIDLAVSDWDTGFNALLHSIAAGSLDVLDVLLQAGADAKTPVKIEATREVLYPLTATLTLDDRKVAVEMVRRLIDKEAHVGSGDASNVPIFHRAVAANNLEIAHAFLRYDSKTARIMLNLPLEYTPLVSAVISNNLAMVVLLLAYGAKLNVTQEDWDKAVAAQASRSYARADAWRGVLQAVEASLATRNEFYRLLVPLGADINVGVKAAYMNTWNAQGRGTLIEAMRENILDVKKALAGPEQTPADSTPSWPPSGPTGSWKNEFFNIMQRLTDSRKSASSKDGKEDNSVEIRRRKQQLLLSYMTDVEKYLAERGAKTWDEINTEADKTRAARLDNGGNDSNYTPKPYKRYDRQEVGDYAIAGYDSLFEACWKGDDARIVELCMPPAGHTRDGQRPLEIGAMVPQNNTWWNAPGFGPFTVACLAKRWHTARLVLTIAAAQWEKPGEERRKPQTFAVSDDEDSDVDSEASYDDDEGPINLADIAARVSQVHSSTSPHDLIMAPFEWAIETPAKTTTTVTLLSKAVKERDLEAFVFIANVLDEHSKDSEAAMSAGLPDILAADAPYILDEYIRRTGMGIKVTSASITQEEDDADEPKTSKIYLGLNVHGKKRNDLARRGDPDAPVTYVAEQAPLLWQACKRGAIDIIAWLKTSSVASAYRFYAQTKSTDRALILRRIDLDTKLPELLGFYPSTLNETAMFAAVLGQPEALTTVLKQLVKTYPDHGAHLHLAARATRLTPLLLLAVVGDSRDALEFLLGQGVDITSTDARGYNILHIVCDNGRAKLFDAIMQRVPQNTLKSLVAQQSYRRRNTPFMIAVKRGYKNFVSALLNIVGQEVVNIGDVDMLPIHAATKFGYAEILSMLLQHGADVTRENSLGETSLDTAKREEAKQRKSRMNENTYVSELRVDNIPQPDPVPMVLGKHELQQVNDVISMLSDDGIWRGSNQALSDHLDSLLATLPQRETVPQEQTTPSVDEPVRDSCDRRHVFSLLTNAVAAGKPRALVHLMDTQLSTTEALALLKSNSDDSSGSAQAREWHAENPEDREEQSIMKMWHIGLYDINPERI
ncbi:ankyrin [Exidia glandulosa HHB12029]|uniref:Ankyrin n=1 Tax=Exidia glandulosa HHB12029 TaxID=1314781 RepID=A0A165N6I8_EXIGL|nr:ankyrin [Exidia glandulosa HHB12029]